MRCRCLEQRATKESRNISAVFRTTTRSDTVAAHSCAPFIRPLIDSSSAFCSSLLASQPHRRCVLHSLICGSRSTHSLPPHRSIVPACCPGTCDSPFNCSIPRESRRRQVPSKSGGPRPIGLTSSLPVIPSTRPCPDHL